MDSQNLWITLHEHHKLDDVSACWHGRKISVRRKIYKSQLRESSHASQPSWFQAAASNVAQWTAFKARRFKAALLCNEEKKKRKSVRRWLRFKGRSQWREKRFCCARVTWATRFVSWDQARVPELKRPCKIDLEIWKLRANGVVFCIKLVKYSRNLSCAMFWGDMIFLGNSIRI